MYITEWTKEQSVGEHKEEYTDFELVNRRIDRQRMNRGTDRPECKILEQTDKSKPRKCRRTTHLRTDLETKEELLVLLFSRPTFFRR